jgi:hypothetical protein
MVASPVYSKGNRFINYNYETNSICLSTIVIIVKERNTEGGFCYPAPSGYETPPVRGWDGRWVVAGDLRVFKEIDSQISMSDPLP